MNATVNVLCYKSKTLANGQHPLMICIAKDGKRSYRSLGISINPHYWDFEKNKTKRNCPDKEKIDAIIIQKIKEYNQTVLDFNIAQKQYTPHTLIDKVEHPFVYKTVNELFTLEIEKLKQSHRLNYSLSVKQLHTSLLKFNTHLNIYFSDIDVAWLKKYEEYLTKNNLSQNTIAIRFRTLRAIYNIAIQQKCANPQLYPFHTYKVSKLQTNTNKRALTKSHIKKIQNYHPTNSSQQLSLDIFMFSYLMGGINFVDIALLSKQNIIHNQLIYIRKKTKKQIKLPIHPAAHNLIAKYYDADSPYLFPILSSFHQTQQQKANRVHKIIAQTNKDLRSIGKTLKLPIELTTYVARHSFATILKRSGVSTSIISESLGHSSEKVTRIYLDSFENQQLNSAMRNLL